jgi:hypothetical protein
LFAIQCSVTLKNWWWRWLRLLMAVSLFAYCSCGGTSRGSSGTDPQSGMAICNCTPSEPPSSDFRHDAKHIPLPVGVPPQEISVGDIISWGWDAEPAFNAPRLGRELQLMHLAQAFVQFVWLVPGDCDIHMEISATADKSAPRVIVETPVDPSFCPARQNEVAGLARFGVTVTTTGMETAQGIAVDVLGLPFRDFTHQRGTTNVATPWELHPAIVNIH